MVYRIGRVRSFRRSLANSVLEFFLREYLINLRIMQYLQKIDIVNVTSHSKASRGSDLVSFCVFTVRYTSRSMALSRSLSNLPVKYSSHSTTILNFNGSKSYKCGSLLSPTVCRAGVAHPLSQRFKCIIVPSAYSYSCSAYHIILRDLPT